MAIVVFSSMVRLASADEDGFSAFLGQLLSVETSAEKTEKAIGAAQAGAAAYALLDYQNALRAGTATPGMAEDAAKTAAGAAALVGPHGAFLGAAAERVATDGSLQTLTVSKCSNAMLNGDSAAFAVACEERNAAIAESAIQKSPRDPSVDAILGALPGGSEAKLVGNAATLSRIASGAADLVEAMNRHWPGAIDQPSSAEASARSRGEPPNEQPSIAAAGSNQGPIDGTSPGSDTGKSASIYQGIEPPKWNYSVDNDSPDHSLVCDVVLGDDWASSLENIVGLNHDQYTRCGDLKIIDKTSDKVAFRQDCDLFYGEYPLIKYSQSMSYISYFNKIDEENIDGWIKFVYADTETTYSHRLKRCQPGEEMLH